MILLVIERTWGDVIASFLLDPVGSVRSSWGWIVMVLMGLFLLSRFSNTLDQRGVARAVDISHTITGSIMAFVVAPAFIIVFLNIIALIYHLPFVSLRWFYEWVMLTTTSLWWLGKCVFKVNPTTTQIYSVDAMLRIFLIVAPIALVWYRVAQSRLGKSLGVIFLLGILFITRYQKAPETPLHALLPNYTEYEQRVRNKELDSIEWYKGSQSRKTQQTSANPTNRNGIILDPTLDDEAKQWYTPGQGQKNTPQKKTTPSPKKQNER
jgi:hypothetical protein